MKKIKRINLLVLVLIAAYVLFFIGNIYVAYFSNFLNKFNGLYEDYIFGYYTQFVSLFFSIITFIGLLYIKKGLRITLNNGLFNAKSSQNFIKAGRYFLISGLLGCIFEFVIFLHSNGIYMLAGLGQYFLLIILAFVLYIIADIIKNGNDLKIENDLTI